MYESPPTEAEMAAAGLTPEDFAGEAVEIWPENEASYFLFGALSTQWRIGMNGPTGLEYASIPVTLRLQGVHRSEWTQLFEDLRVMEGAALTAIRTRE